MSKDPSGPTPAAPSGGPAVPPRASRTEWYMNIAIETARRSTCIRRCYGAVVVNSAGEIVSTGHNGAPRGEAHCDELNTCIRKQYNIPSGERYEFCRSVHAEMNALLQAGRAAAGCTMYLAGFERLTGAPSYDPPCLMCSKMLVNAGVGRVIVRTPEGLADLDPQALYRRHLESVIAKVSGR